MTTHDSPAVMVPKEVFWGAAVAAERARALADKAGADALNMSVAGLQAGLGHVVEWCQGNGWTIAPPMVKARAIKRLKGGIDDTRQ